MRKLGLLPSPSSSSSSLSSLSKSSSNLSFISTSSTAHYDVFLSFRGPDTRNRFADCLYNRLIEAGINVFRDVNNLPPGRKINDALIEHIKQSEISMPIISTDYASSRSCLMELAQMLECNKADNQLILPIFYNIDIKELKYPQGCVKNSFSKHEERGVDREDIAKWKRALREIAEISGWDITNNRHEGELIKKVVSKVLLILKKNDLVVPAKLVGIEPRVREIMGKLRIVHVNEQATEITDKDVHVLGICGMPGVGKTTLAKSVYNKIHHLFQGCSFLSEIPKKIEANGLMRLQARLISDLRKQEPRRLGSPDEGTIVIANSFKKMRVLILIDDVHEFDQIKYLVGDLSWFGPGSRILMTIGRRDILDNYTSEVTSKYEVEPMERHQALQLFCKHAFDEHPPEKSEYNILSGDIVDIIEGLPLAIEVIASYLRNKKGQIQIWRDTLDRLKSSKLENKVKEVINVSYGALEEDTKEIFLDIACFFIGMDDRISSCMWNACAYYPSRGIDSLCAMCLVKIGENHELWMHNQLRDFGRHIVKMEHPKPWKRSRIWDHGEALLTLNRKKIAENVEALALTFDAGQSECFRFEGFGHPWSLRFLRLDQATIRGSSQGALSKLRWLDWQGCSEISELLILHLENMVILDLSRSLVTGDSQVWRQILEKAKELKVLKLSSCRNLHASPNFHTSMCLKRVILERCSLLSQIGRSLGNLKNLVSLNLKFCKFVKDLPEELCHMKTLEELLIDGTSIRTIHFRPASMEKLKILSARQCGSLVTISTSIGQLISLSYLGLDGTGIDRLPDSIGSLKKLQSLLLGNCRELTKLPSSIGHLESLEVMDLSRTRIKRLPRSVRNLKNLKVLKMENTHLRGFPKDIKGLQKLEEIDLSQCKNLKGPIRCDITGLSSLKILRLSSTKTSGLLLSDQKLKLLSHLQRLDLSECDQVRVLPTLPSNLSSLRWGSKKMKFLPELSYLKYLKELYLGDNMADPTQKSSSKPQKIGWVSSLVNLEILELCFSKITLLEDFSALQLRKLVLHCADLLDLQVLPSSLSTLCLRHCKIQVLRFSRLTGLSELQLEHCGLVYFDSLEDLKPLQFLKISHCIVPTLDGLENLPRFRKLTLFKCYLTKLPDPTDEFEIDLCEIAEETRTGPLSPLWSEIQE